MENRIVTIKDFTDVFEKAGLLVSASSDPDFTVKTVCGVTYNSKEKTVRVQKIKIKYANEKFKIYKRAYKISKDIDYSQK